MPVDLEQKLKAFAKQATALADTISNEGATPSIRGPGGPFQAHVHVDIASSPHALVEQLQSVATSIGHYLKTRRVGRGQPPEG